MNPPGYIERGFAMLLLFLSTGAFTNLFLGRSFDPTAGLPFMQAIWTAVYLVVLLLLFQEGRAAWSLLRNGWPFLPLLAVVLLSIVWSDAQGLTARRGLALLATTMAGLYLATRYDFAEQVQLLMPVFKVAVVFSFIFSALQIGKPVDNLPDAWFGIFPQRNSLGTMMSLSMLVFLLWSRIAPQERWGAYCWAFLSFVLLALSRSATGFLSIGAVVLFMVLLRQVRLHPQRSRQIFLLAVVAAGFGLYYVMTNFTAVVGMLDRDVTLSGRTTIWGSALILGMDHFWIGHGYNAFWLGDVGPSGAVRQIAGWDVPGAHNGFLELWLDLGLLGLTLFLLGFIRHTRKAMQFFLRRDHWESVWPIAFLLFLFVVNLAQSDLLSPNYLHWILYAAISYRVCLVTATRSEGAM